MPSDGTTAFISYSREDSEFVLRMARDLKAAGANVWLDQLDIQPGQRWARALQEAITNAPRFLVILSPASVKSTNVEDEVSFALEERKTIIPVMYSDCNVPFQLRSFQYADFRHDYDRGLKILLQTMGVEVPAGTAAVVEGAQPKVADAGEQARRERDAKQAAEQLQRQEARKATERAAAQRRKEAAEKARVEEEARLAAERAAEEKKRKEAQRQTILAQERKEAQERAQAQERKEPAAAETSQQQREPGLLGRVVKSGATILIFVGVAYWVFFRGSNPPPQPAPVSHARVIGLKPSVPPADNGGVSGAAAKGTSAPNSGIATGATTAAGDTGKAALLGVHRLSLQWISWEKFGTASVVDNDGVLVLKGSQHVGDEYLTVEGTVTSIEPKKFTMHGVIVTKIDSINKGQPCKRSGDMTFAITGTQQYWRLQQMDNPCATATDYVDIYLR